MRRVARILVLSLEITASYPRAWWMLRNHELPATLRALRPGGSDGEPSLDDIRTAADLGHAVSRLLTRLPLDSRCLIRSLVLSRMLDRRGIPSKLVIGVEPGETLAAHAWVEVNGQPVLHPGDFADRRLAVL